MLYEWFYDHLSGLREDVLEAERLTVVPALLVQVLDLVEDEIIDTLDELQAVRNRLQVSLKSCG